MTGKRKNLVRHGQLELELPICDSSHVPALVTPLAPAEVPPTPDYDITFMNRSLCVAGLPHRRGVDRMIGTTAEFHRKGQGFSLKVLTPNFELPVEGGLTRSIPLGVPYGAKARLLVLWMASQARLNPGSTHRQIEIGHIGKWLDDIGIGRGGSAIIDTKAQLISLCETIFTVHVRHTRFDEDLVAFKHENLIESGVLEAEDMHHYADGRLDKVRWPRAIRLTEQSWERFNNEVFPVPAARLRQICGCSPAIDLFLYLCYLLPMIPPGETIMVSWRQLGTQFGTIDPSVDPLSIRPAKHRQSFTSALPLVLKAYEEAKIEVTTEGLVLRHSDPAVLRKAYVVGSTLAPAVKSTAIRRRAKSNGDLAMTG